MSYTDAVMAALKAAFSEAEIDYPDRLTLEYPS
jgi:hypothetical protein